jgi:DNA-binding response OmpR family regulator
MSLVLVVEDDEPLARLIRSLLITAGHDVVVARSGAEAIGALDVSPELLVLDLRLGDEDGREVFTAVRQQGYAGKVLICSAFGARQAAAQLGADGWVAKPFDPEVLIGAVTKLVSETCAKPC